MEESYVVARYSDVARSQVVVASGLPSADVAQQEARRRHGNTGDEYFAARIVPVRLDTKSSLVILREQTAAIASCTTSTQTRTEQIYHELTALRELLPELFGRIQKLVQEREEVAS